MRHTIRAIAIALSLAGLITAFSASVAGAADESVATCPDGMELAADKVTCIAEPAITIAESSPVCEIGEITPDGSACFATEFALEPSPPVIQVDQIPATVTPNEPDYRCPTGYELIEAALTCRATVSVADTTTSQIVPDDGGAAYCPEGTIPKNSGLCSTPQPDQVVEIPATAIANAADVTCPKGSEGPTANNMCTIRTEIPQPAQAVCVSGTPLDTGEALVCVLENTPVTPARLVVAECPIGDFDANTRLCTAMATPVVPVEEPTLAPTPEPTVAPTAVPDPTPTADGADQAVSASGPSMLVGALVQAPGSPVPSSIGLAVNFGGAAPVVSAPASPAAAATAAPVEPVATVALAATGADSGQLVLLASALVGAGLALLLIAQRREWSLWNNDPFADPFA